MRPTCMTEGLPELPSCVSIHVLRTTGLQEKTKVSFLTSVFFLSLAVRKFWGHKTSFPWGRNRVLYLGQCTGRQLRIDWSELQLAPALLGPSQTCPAAFVLVLGRETLVQLIFHPSGCKVQERQDCGWRQLCLSRNREHNQVRA